MLFIAYIVVINAKWSFRLNLPKALLLLLYNYCMTFL